MTNLRRVGGWRTGFVVAVAMGAAACKIGGTNGTSGAGSAAAVASATPSASSSASAPMGGTVSFVVKPTQHADLQLLQALFDSKDYPGAAIAKALSGGFVWPNDVTEQVLDCGVLNAFYDPTKHTVNLCYELAGYYYGFFAKAGPFFARAGLAGKTPTSATVEAMTFTQLHETGHALIKELGIGAMGNEETDVDGFATVTLLKAKLPQVARDGAVAMISLLGITGAKPQYFDEHPPSQERFAEILCIVYGSDPSANADLIANHLVDAARAPKCQAEYTNTLQVWDTLLKPHEKAK
jgi:hypothetical protein